MVTDLNTYKNLPEHKGKKGLTQQLRQAPKETQLSQWHRDAEKMVTEVNALLQEYAPDDSYDDSDPSKSADSGEGNPSDAAGGDGGHGTEGDDEGGEDN